MRMANADILPFDFNAFHKTISEYVDEVKTLLENTRNETDISNKMLNEKVYAIAYDPTQKFPGPKLLESVPILNFSPIDNALLKLKENAELFSNTKLKSIVLPTDKRKQLNEILYRAERSLLQETGLPHRPWFKHQIHAPGMYTGYGVKTLPAVREAIEQRSWNEAQTGIDIIAETLKNYNQQILQAVNLLK
jgi:N-acetylated-alpha-linked acidic dipeptidase